MRSPKEIILSKGQTLEQELEKDIPNLCGADLCGADLCGADLREANLREANLCGADLREANLRGANLREANLSGANMICADLYGADLYGTNLSETYLSDVDSRGAYLNGAKNIISIVHIGPRVNILYAVRGDNGPMVRTGHFWGTLGEFEVEVSVTHGNPADNRVSGEYRYVIDLIRTWGK